MTKSTDPPPTIGRFQEHGITGFFVYCSAPHCHHEKRFTFDALKLPDELAFIDIAKTRRFVRESCGRHEVTLSLDWTEYYASLERERKARP